MSSKDRASWKPTLQLAEIHARQAHFDTALAACQNIVDLHGDDFDALLSVAALLSSFGFVSAAQQCNLRARTVDPNNFRPVMGLANLARDTGDHAECGRLYNWLLQHLPGHEVILRNAQVSLEYDPAASDESRFERVKEWGRWAMEKAGGERERPPLRPLEGRPLRVGYVSADFCQHTVGLFVKDVLATHDKTRVSAFAYNVGRLNDWVTKQIQAACVVRDMAVVDDRALADRIRQDEIDILVDLSGHTSGSRLSMFAYRPAPVQVSWLGYFATTGLSVMDAVLLDEWHAPSGTETQFVEDIIYLPGGRFCYTPAPFAPAGIDPAPCLSRGRITFGSFNNTGKLNAEVYDVWSRVLIAVPDSRLVLKWRTFHDAAMCDKVRAAFRQRGVAPERIELRGASFHADLLKEYADIDIALDPFPFTGGMTSCEALWMGVPVVTWPQSRVVSRQTFAFLSAIGLPELAAQDGDDYVRIAVRLAAKRERLIVMREGMRERMRASPLMDLPGFTRQLEQLLIDLYLYIGNNRNDPI